MQVQVFLLNSNQERSFVPQVAPVSIIGEELAIICNWYAPSCINDRAKTMMRNYILD